MKEDIDTNLDPAILYFGNQSKIARSLDVNPMTVTQWKRRGIPPERAIQISEVSGGRILPSDLKPKFFSLVR